MAQRVSKAEQKPRVYVIDPKRQKPYEIGAMLITLMAFPSETVDDNRFAELHASLCTGALLTRARSDAHWASSYTLAKPVHFSVSERDVESKLRSLPYRLRDRMIAGRITNAILFDAANLNPKLPKGCEGFAIGQLIKMALEDTGQLEAKNAEQRIWRASLPVAHICAAVQAYMNLEGRRDFEVSVGEFIFNVDAIAWILDQILRTQELMAARPERFRPPRAARVVLQTQNITISPTL